MNPEYLLNSIAEYAIFQVDLTGQIVYANSGASRIFNTPVSEIKGTLHSFCPIQDVQPETAEIGLQAEATKLGASENYNIRTKPNGAKIWAHTVYSPIYKNDEQLGFSVVIRDLTERRLAEGKYKGLVDTAPDAMILIDRQGSINLINEKTEALFGYTRAELLGQPIQILLAETGTHMGDLLQTWLNKLDQAENYITLQIQIKNKSGAILPAEVNLRSVTTGAGEFISCSARDITSRLKMGVDLELATQNVNRLYKWLQGIIDGNKSLIAGVDTSFRFVAFNKAYRDFFKDQYGVTIKVGDQAKEYLTHLPEQFVFLASYWDKALKGEEFDVDHQSIIENKKRVYKLSFNSVKNERGTLIGAAHIVTDITAQYESEILLNKSLIQAQEAARLKQEFLANMSHEIRTPMNAILGFTRLLLKSHDIEGENREYVSTISNSTKDLLVIVNDILDFSKFEAAQMSLEKVHFNLKERLVEIKQLFNYKVLEKGLDIKLTVDNTIPDIVVNDPVRINQLITNLLSNAIKFTSKGHVELKAKLIHLGTNTCAIQLQVIDSGMGIDPSKLDVIFKSFQQAEGHISRKFGGTGLGLAIVKNIVELLEGTISVESQIDAGSKFTVSFSCPIGDKILVEQDFDHIIEPDQAYNIRVLMAEDNRNNQVLGRKILSDFGCVVDIAKNGREAVDMVVANYYDIVLMDIQMPEMDGVSAVREIRKLPGPKSKIPIIAVTAHAMREEQMRYLEEGMNACITKPFHPKELFMTMVTLVNFEPAATKNP